MWIMPSRSKLICVGDGLVTALQPGSVLPRGQSTHAGLVGLLEIDAPEMRRGRQKFHADVLPFFRIVAEVSDAAFLFFLREGAGEYQDHIYLEWLCHMQHAAIGADDNGLRGFTETLPGLVLPGDCHTDVLEHARASPFAFVDDWPHRSPMFAARRPQRQYPWTGVFFPPKGVAAILPARALCFLATVCPDS